MNNKKHRDRKIVVVSAPSGAGKTTVVNALIKQYPEQFSRTVSHTSRAMRQGEQEGKDYFFVSSNEFEALIEKKHFVEWAKVYACYYGTSFDSIDAILDDGKTPVLVIEEQGAQIIKQKYDNAMFVLLLPPSLDVLKKRLTDRGDKSESIKQRLSKAQSEIEAMHWYDHRLVNNDVNRAVAALYRLV